MNDFTLGEKAKNQLAEKGLNENTVRSQVEALNGQPSFVHLDRPCTVGDGITPMSDADRRRYCDLYEKKLSGFVAAAFIPGSGAASRMFSRLISGDEKSLESFAENLDRFAFWGDLKEAAARLGRGDVENLVASRKYGDIVDTVLSPEGLGYGDIPKGLVKFHRYGKVSKTAFEEQVELAGLYARGADGICRVHFTVSQSFSGEAGRHLDAVARRVGNARVSFSVQNPETDTVAVDCGGNLITDESGRIVFRPAGHGALLYNLGRIDANLVFISNIDNISHGENAAKNRACSKKSLAGLLIETREKICAFMRESENGAPGENAVSEARKLCLRFGFPPPQDGERSPKDLVNFLRNALNRPLRVCGVVGNTAEPGGGPFWAEDPFGRVSPQIVESVQVRPDCAGQMNVWRSSTHFNPVDIVCSMDDCAGERFNLRDYSDGAHMITEKTFGGRRVRSLEMPGLWNGAMAGWNTLFAEIPSGDFSPVKDVFDLLRDSHRGAEAG